MGQTESLAACPPDEDPAFLQLLQQARLVTDFYHNFESDEIHYSVSIPHY